MSRRAPVPPSTRQALIAAFLAEGRFNQKRLMRAAGICRDTARRDTRRFLQSTPWLYRYDDRRKVYVPTADGQGVS